MPKKLRTVTQQDLDYLANAIRYLRSTRDKLLAAGCPKLADETRRLLKRVEGAQRHAQRAENKGVNHLRGVLYDPIYDPKN